MFICLSPENLCVPERRLSGVLKTFTQENRVQRVEGRTWDKELSVRDSIPAADKSAWPMQLN